MKSLLDLQHAMQTELLAIRDQLGPQLFAFQALHRLTRTSEIRQVMSVAPISKPTAAAVEEAMRQLPDLLDALTCWKYDVMAYFGRPGALSLLHEEDSFDYYDHDHRVARMLKLSITRASRPSRQSRFVHYVLIRATRFCPIRHDALVTHPGPDSNTSVILVPVQDNFPDQMRQLGIHNIRQHVVVGAWRAPSRFENAETYWLQLLDLTEFKNPAFAGAVAIASKLRVSVPSVLDIPVRRHSSRTEMPVMKEPAATPIQSGRRYAHR